MPGTAPARTPSQNRRLWGLVGELAVATGSTREEAELALRRQARAVSGQEHTSRLSRDQAQQVITLLEREIHGQQAEVAQREERQPWGPRGPGPREKVGITERQVQVLQALFVQAGLDSQQKQMAFSSRQCKRPWPQTHREYDQIFEALKGMVLRAVVPMDAWARAKAIAQAPELNDWQRGFLADLCRQFQAAQAAGDISTVLTTHKLAKLTEAEVAAGVEA